MKQGANAHNSDTIKQTSIMLVALYTAFVLVGVAVIVTVYAFLSATDGHEDCGGFHPEA